MLATRLASGFGRNLQQLRVLGSAAFEVASAARSASTAAPTPGPAEGEEEPQWVPEPLPLDELPSVSSIDQDQLPSFIVSESKKKPPVDLATALKQVKESARRDSESVDVSVKLSIDPRRGDQIVRSVAQLPHGTGKASIVAVFATGEAAEKAKAAGADIVGDESLIEDIRTSKSIPFDKCIAMQDMVPKLSKIARILGPRGLMPNPKLGTIVNAGTMVDKLNDMKKGQVAYRNEKQGFVYAGIGRASFSEEQLRDNLTALLASVMAAKPKVIKATGAKGYIERVALSTTQGRGVRVKFDSITALVG